MQEGPEAEARQVREEEAAMTRHTFVVQVHPEGISTLENLSTRERVRLDEIAEIGPLIERWLAELPKLEASVTPPQQQS
jgi:hypothetical protein